MNISQVLDLAAVGLLLAAKLAAPALVTALVLGLTVSIFQSITQIQEATLSFVPKLIGIGIVLMVTGNWMLTELVVTTQELFARIPTLLAGG